jgi:hypothetical protein
MREKYSGDERQNNVMNVYVFIVHVGGTCCVTWSLDRIILIHARITWGVVLIPRNFFHLFLVCLTDITTTIHFRLFSMFGFIRYVKSFLYMLDALGV